MKKLMISILIILLIVLTGVTVVKGIKIGNINIPGVLQLKEQNEELDIEVKEATKLASTDYQKKVDELNEKVKELQNKRNEYLDLENVSTEQQINGANSLNKPYKSEYLYTAIGNHAKNNKIKIGMNFTRSASGDTNYYDINFTATGSYIRIAEFIMDVEDDSSLGFKIEEFKMTPSAEGGDVLQATFVCKNIRVEDISSSTSIPSNTGTTENTTTNQNNVIAENNTVQ